MQVRRSNYEKLLMKDKKREFPFITILIIFLTVCLLISIYIAFFHSSREKRAFSEAKYKKTERQRTKEKENKLLSGQGDVGTTTSVKQTTSTALERQKLVSHNNQQQTSSNNKELPLRPKEKYIEKNDVTKEFLNPDLLKLEKEIRDGKDKVGVNETNPQICQHIQAKLKEDKNIYTFYKNLQEVKAIFDEVIEEREAISKCLKEELSGLLARLMSKIKNLAFYQSLETVISLKNKLNLLRQKALTLIFDVNFYPTNKEKTANKATLEAQKKIDEIIQKVKEMYNTPQNNIYSLTNEEIAYLRSISFAFKFLKQVGIFDEEVKKILAGYSVIPIIFERLTEKRKITVDFHDILLSEWEVEMRKRDIEVDKLNGELKDFMKQDELALINEVNLYRELLGLNHLRIDKRLVAAARFHAKYMRERNILSHEEDIAETKTPQLRAEKFGFKNGVGENIAYKTMINSPSEIFELWYNSPGHHRIMLTKDAHFIGCANDGIYWVLLIGR